MELAPWVPLASWAIAAVAAMALWWNAYQVLNRESVARRRASEALSLLKAWDETKLGEVDHGDLRAKQSLRHELVQHAFRSTQVYVSSTKPTLISYWQPFIILMLGLFSFWVITQPMEVSDFKDPWVVAMVMGVPLSAIFLAMFMAMRVSRHHDDENALKKSRKRKAISVKSKANRSVQDKRNRVSVAVDSKRVQIKKEGLNDYID